MNIQTDTKIPYNRGCLPQTPAIMAEKNIQPATETESMAAITHLGSVTITDAKSCAIRPLSILRQSTTEFAQQEQKLLNVGFSIKPAIGALKRKSSHKSG